MPIKIMAIPAYLLRDKLSLNSKFPTIVLNTTLRENKVDIMPKFVSAFLQ